MGVPDTEYKTAENAEYRENPDKKRQATLYNEMVGFHHTSITAANSISHSYVKQPTVFYHETVLLLQCTSHFVA